MTSLTILHAKLRSDSSMLVAQSGGDVPSIQANAAHCHILRALRKNPDAAETQELVELLNVTRSRINCAVVKTGRQAPGRVTRAQAAQVIADKKAARELAIKAKPAMSLAAQSRQDQEEN
jgi:hypothetical protein